MKVTFIHSKVFVVTYQEISQTSFLNFHLNITSTRHVPSPNRRLQTHLNCNRLQFRNLLHHIFLDPNCCSSFVLLFVLLACLNLQIHCHLHHVPQVALYLVISFQLCSSISFRKCQVVVVAFQLSLTWGQSYSQQRAPLFYETHQSSHSFHLSPCLDYPSLTFFRLFFCSMVLDCLYPPCYHEWQ